MSFVVAALFRWTGLKGEVISLIRASSFRVQLLCVCVYSYRLLGLKVQGGCGVQRVDPFGSAPAPAAQEPQVVERSPLIILKPLRKPCKPLRGKKPWL